MISANRLRELLEYKPDSGQFIWRISRGRVREGDIAGHKRYDGYINIHVDKEIYVAHRLAWLWLFGRWPVEVDHINGDRSDNRRSNLRECVRWQNFANSKKRAGKILPKGVRLEYRRFSARITVNYKEKHLGTFATAAEAHAAYVKAAKKYFGEFANSGEVVER